MKLKKKSISKKDYQVQLGHQSQLELIFETRDSNYKVGTNLIEGQPEKKHENKSSINKILKDEIEKTIKKNN
jgi:hypothetical protein